MASSMELTSSMEPKDVPGIQTQRMYKVIAANSEKPPILEDDGEVAKYELTQAYILLSPLKGGLL
jgi:hypothetical protein